MEQKKCKEKTCQRPLPKGYRYKYCESCRNMKANKTKKGIKVVVGTVVGVALTIVTKGKIKLNKN